MATTAARTSAFVLALVACHHADDDLATKLEKVRAGEKLPALAIGVWKHGEQVALAATGLRKADDPSHPVTVNDRWHLGSDTKAMTATLVGIYVDRGKLHWDDTLGKLFAGETIDPGLANVTLDQLLQHRAGLPHDPPALTEHEFRELGDTPEARTRYVRLVLAMKPEHVGTYSYSNAGYVLLGAAIERASGKRWEEVIREDLFAPLGMTECGFGAPGHGDAVDQPWGHAIGPIPPGPLADNPPAMAPAGAVNCSLASWAKFLSVHAAPQAALVTAATFTHLHTPPMVDRERYTSGWIIRELPGTDLLAYAHEGSNTHWHAIAVVVPGRDTVIAIVANRFDENLFRAVFPLVQSYLN